MTVDYSAFDRTRLSGFVRTTTAHAAALGVQVQTAVFASKTDWQHYALDALLTVRGLAKKLGIADRLHLWPDKSLGAKAVAEATGNPEAHMQFIYDCWNRISEWPQ